MPTPSTANIQNFQHCGHLLWEYSFYVRRELRNPNDCKTGTKSNSNRFYFLACLSGINHIDIFNNNRVTANPGKSYKKTTPCRPPSEFKIPA
jgi:hypothetical protein